VRNVGGPGHPAPFGEHWHGQHHIIEVGHSAAVRVVTNEDITVLDIVWAGMLKQDLFDRLVQHADKGRDAGSGTGDVTVGVGDAGAHVQHLIDHRAHRRFAHGGEHLVGNGLQRVLDNVAGEDVECMHGDNPVSR